MKLNMKFRNETKSCYRFDPHKGITVTIEEAENVGSKSELRTIRRWKR